MSNTTNINNMKKIIIELLGIVLVAVSPVIVVMIGKALL